MLDIRRHRFVFLAILLTAVNLLLVWSFRFLPLYDYPVWLYEVRIMRSLSDPMFSRAYDLVAAPVPNLGFVGPVWVLSFFFPFEVSGKLLLSFCVVAFPWAVGYCTRVVSISAESPAAYIGFPFAFNIYFFGGNAFLVGVIVMLLVVGYFVPRLDQMSKRRILALSVVVLLTYLAHLLACVLLILALAGAILAQKESRRNLRMFLLALLPSAVCLLWYALSVSPPGERIGEWSLWGLAQNALKPIFLFVKSYAISNTLPLTALNLMWLMVLVAFLWRLVVESHKNKIDRRFMLVACISAVAMVAMPKIFFGVYEPGIRFGLPALLFVLLFFSRAQMSQRWTVVFLVAALCVTFYNAVHFKKGDEQMRELYHDVVSQVDLRGKTFRSVRFDYPPPRNLWDVAAASIDPLFGVVYYAALNKGGGPAWVFGSALLTEDTTRRQIASFEREKEELARELLTASSLADDVIVLVGNDPALTRWLPHSQVKYFQGKDWVILENRSATGEPQK